MGTVATDVKHEGKMGRRATHRRSGNAIETVGKGVKRKYMAVGAVNEESVSDGSIEGDAAVTFDVAESKDVGKGCATIPDRNGATGDPGESTSVSGMENAGLGV